MKHKIYCLVIVLLFVFLGLSALNCSRGKTKVHPVGKKGQVPCLCLSSGGWIL